MAWLPAGHEELVLDAFYTLLQLLLLILSKTILVFIDLSISALTGTPLETWENTLLILILSIKTVYLLAIGSLRHRFFWVDDDVVHTWSHVLWPLQVPIATLYIRLYLLLRRDWWTLQNIDWFLLVDLLWIPFYLLFNIIWLAFGCVDLLGGLACSHSYVLSHVLGPVASPVLLRLRRHTHTGSLQLIWHEVLLKWLAAQEACGYWRVRRFHIPLRILLHRLLKLILIVTLRIE